MWILGIEHGSLTTEPPLQAFYLILTVSPPTKYFPISLGHFFPLLGLCHIPSPASLAMAVSSGALSLDLPSGLVFLFPQADAIDIPLSIPR